MNLAVTEGQREQSRGSYTDVSEDFEGGQEHQEEDVALEEPWRSSRDKTE
jgi:hypothetical protein